MFAVKRRLVGAFIKTAKNKPLALIGVSDFNLGNLGK